MYKWLAILLFFTTMAFGNFEVTDEGIKLKTPDSLQGVLIKPNPLTSESYTWILPITKGTASQAIIIDSIVGDVVTLVSGVPGAATPHDVTGPTHTDAATATVVRGDLLVGNATPKWDRLAIGTGVLHGDGTDVTGWSVVDISDDTNLVAGTNLTLAGDTINLDDPATVDIIGSLTGNADTATLASTVTVVDSTDATSFVAMFDSATGSLAAKTDAGLTYDATAGGLVIGDAVTGSSLLFDLNTNEKYKFQADSGDSDQFLALSNTDTDGAATIFRLYPPEAAKTSLFQLHSSAIVGSRTNNVRLSLSQSTTAASINTAKSGSGVATKLSLMVGANTGQFDLETNGNLTSTGVFTAAGFTTLGTVDAAIGDITTVNATTVNATTVDVGDLTMGSSDLISSGGDLRINVDDDLVSMATSYSFTGLFGVTGNTTITGTLLATGVTTIIGIADGGRTNFDLKVGDTDGTPTYGMIQFGNAVIGRTSYKAGNIDLDGSVIVQNISGPITSEIEFVWTESAGDTCRFALPKSAVGNATYNSRSMILAGPAPADTDFVKVSYWQGQGIFDNLVCDTAGTGADLGVQNDLEVEGDIFVDSIKESTSGAGITINNNLSFAGSGGFIQGHMHIPAVDITVDTSATANPVEVADDGTTSAGDGWASTYQNGTVFAASDLHYITITIAGTYEVIWDYSVRTAAGGGSIIHGGITIDTTTFVRDNGESHTHTFNANDDIHISSVGVIDCPNGNEEISLWISNNAGQKTIVEHGNMRVQMIGGT